jgi:hypothetical protein
LAERQLTLFGQFPIAITSGECIEVDQVGCLKLSLMRKPLRATKEYSIPESKVLQCFEQLARDMQVKVVKTGEADVHIALDGPAGLTSMGEVMNFDAAFLRKQRAAAVGTESFNLAASDLVNREQFTVRGHSIL